MKRKMWHRALLLGSVFLWLSGGVGLAQGLQPPTPFSLPLLLEWGDTVHLVVVPEESEVAFDAHATLHNFTGRSRPVDGTVEGIPTALEASGSGFVTVKAASLTTGNDLRDRNMRAMLAVDRYPEIRFILDQAKIDGPPKDDHTVTLLISGQLRVRDVTRSLRLPVTISVQPDRLIVTGRFPLTFTEVGLTPPSFLFVKVADHLQIRFRLVARPLSNRPPLDLPQNPASPEKSPFPPQPP